MAERLPDNDETRDHQECRNVVCRQSSFWFEDAIMTPDVAIGKEVVEEMPKYFSQCHSNDWGEVPALLSSIYDQESGQGALHMYLHIAYSACAEPIPAGFTRCLQKDG